MKPIFHKVKQTDGILTMKEIDEGLIRMLESGWILHKGEITENDIKTHEFNIMGDNTFKKLKEGNHDPIIQKEIPLRKADQL